MLTNGVASVAVLGAGIAGVQAALDLANLGHRVFLLERAKRPGGKLAVLPKTFPTNDCSACVLTPQDAFFCIRSPHFIKLAEQGKITLFVDTEVRKISEALGNFKLYLDRLGKTEELQASAIILCPGYEEYLPPTLSERYGYGRYPGVITGLELEQFLAVKGVPRRPWDGEPARRIAFIQCAGSRDPSNGVAYCSAVCCMYAVKESIMIGEAAKALGISPPEITFFYMDLRTYGKTYERYVKKAREEYGLRLVRTRIHSILQPPGGSGLVIRYALENGEVQVEEFDLAVLSTGLRAQEGLKNLAQELEIELDVHGFGKSPLVSPVYTLRPGIFLAGAFTGPCDVIDAVTQGSAAAAACATWLRRRSSPGKSGGSPQPAYISNSFSNDSPPRIGIFLCQCDQLASGLDLTRLAEYSRSLPDVTWVQSISLCEPTASQELQQALCEHQLNRVVVAGCSARALEPIVAGSLAKAGLSGSAVRVVNILDHAVHIYRSRPQIATRKAADLLRIAVARVRAAVASSAVEDIPVVPAALVVGGGVAGMVSALTLADLGYIVHLVEKERYLGGHTLRLGKTLINDDLQTWLSELVHQVTRHPQIHVHLEARPIKTEGKVGGFKTVLELNGKKGEKIIEHGVTILATGAVEKKSDQYLYGRHPAVITGLELEDLIKNNSRRFASLRRIVFIQCVDSRDAGHPYCSRTCCSETLKNALELKKINPGMEIYVLNRDVMAYGLWEQWYEAARSQGVIFLRYTPESPPAISVCSDNDKETEGSSLQVRAFDPILGEELTIRAHLVVLATGIEPRPENAYLSALFQVTLDEDGFFATGHPKLKPVQAQVPGIFICGLAEGPKHVEETVASAQAAALKAAVVLAKEHLPLPRQVARVEGACAACLTCVRICPYGAPSIKGNRSSIEPLLCQGCGACVTACPAGAITLAGYSGTEMDAELWAAAGEPGEMPATVIFTCSYCAYATWENIAEADSQREISVLQVPCLSRIGTLEVLKAVEAGARQVVLTGCVEGQCHFRPARAFGSDQARSDPMLCQEQAWSRAKKILAELGWEENTLRIFRLPPPPSSQKSELIGHL